jgi:hypothetical protein
MQTTLHKIALGILRRRRSLAQKPREEKTTTTSHSGEMSLPASRSLYQDNHLNRNATLEIPQRIRATLLSRNMSNTLLKVSVFLLLRQRLKAANTPDALLALQIRIATRSLGKRFLAPTRTDKAMVAMYRQSR